MKLILSLVLFCSFVIKSVTKAKAPLEPIFILSSFFSRLIDIKTSLTSGKITLIGSTS